MAEKPEKICKQYTGQKYKKWLKRVAKRFRRRLEKQFGEDAPKKNQYYGWSD